ncbi:MAG: GGDEF domain-containing protein [Gammaproteobacteria bacterium]|nr:GGDEF domain-containing protein [Gammaproteobacteria bacterium]MBQ0773776.1 GGDEF domain-containing protein [Gammaproteobacteria bacterium]
MQQYEDRQLTPLAQWSFITRSSAPLMLLIALWLAHTAWAVLVLFMIDEQKVFSLDSFRVQLPIVTTMLVGAGFLLALGQMLRVSKLEPMWYQHISANYYGLSLVWGGYITGSLSIASGAVLMGAPLLGFLLLERRVVAIAFLISFLALLFLNAAAAAGLIPYAPFVHPPTDQASAILWTHSQLLMAAPHILVDLYLCAVLFSQWRLREESVRALGLTDSLTGLHNRRSILAQLNRELARAHRQNKTLSLVLFDLDHFKKINDIWGHPAGDEVLRRTAHAIADEIRTSDLVGRFGGEEFMLVLPQTEEQSANQLVERCRQRIETLHVISENGETIPVRASFGLVNVNATDQANPESLIARADEALYQAKAAGRNCIKTTNYTEQPMARKSLHSGNSTPRNWRAQLQLLRHKHNWQLFLNSILDWTPVNKARLTAGLSLLMGINVSACMTVALLHDQIVNVAIAKGLLITTFLLSTLSVLFIWVGQYVNRLWPGSKWYQLLVLYSFGLTLVGYGYIIGLLYMPTGIMLLCSPVIGFLLFDRRIVLQVLNVCAIAIVALSYLTAYGYLPYAPLLSPINAAWHFSNPFWVTNIYFITSYIMIVTFILIDHVLGRWSVREAEILELSLTDSLTRVANRHSVFEQLRSTLTLSTREQQPLSLVILDLDHFKRINDTWGHPCGDSVLMATAAAVKAVLREGDTIGRFGGEEFLLVLPNTDIAGAAVLAERCRIQIERVAVYSENNELIPITASFGVVCNENRFIETQDSLIKAADDALYSAKKEGRNRVNMATWNDKNRKQGSSSALA